MKLQFQSLRRTPLVCAALGSALTLTSANAALTVNVNFDYTVTNRTGLVGPAGGAGETWNQAMGGTHGAAGGFYSNSTVLDSVGGSTGITWSLQRSDGGALFRWVGSEDATFSTLKHGIFTNSNLTHTLTITGLDFNKTYDFYLTSYNTNFGPSPASHTTANTTSTTGPQVITNVNNTGTGLNSDTWILNENYIVFEDMVPDGTGTIAIDAAKSSNYAFWSGFQLVEVAPPADPVFRITSFSPVAVDTWELTLEAAANTVYEFRSSTDLAFSPGTLIENLTQDNPGTDPGTITGTNDEYVTTNGAGLATVRVPLTGPKNFVRAQKPGALPLLTAVRAGQARTVVIAGTSLSTVTYGNWPALMETWLKSEAPDPAKVTVVNLAVSGSNSQTGGINKLANIKGENPDTVFIEFSMNDAYVPYAMSEAQSTANHNFIINDLLTYNPDMEIIIQTMNNPEGSGLGPRPDIANYYQVARDVATSQGLLLIDHHPNWLNLYNTDPTTWNTYVGDGLHPNSTGYTNVLMPELQSALEP